MQITEARRAHKLSSERLKNNVPASSASEVLLSLQALSLAQSSYVNALLRVRQGSASADDTAGPVGVMLPQRRAIAQCLPEHGQ